MKKVVLGMMLCMLAGCQTQTAESVDADKELDYCAGQVTKALEAIHEADGDYDFTMMPRNILEGETVWSRRKASEQEWCFGETARLRPRLGIYCHQLVPEGLRTNTKRNI